MDDIWHLAKLALIPVAFALMFQAGYWALTGERYHNSYDRDCTMSRVDFC